jgi:cytochrome P450
MLAKLPTFTEDHPRRPDEENSRTQKNEVKRAVMIARISPFIPPAPVVYKKDLPLWRLLWNAAHSSLAIWPDHAFEALIAKDRVMGIETMLVNDPEAMRYVLTTNSANYQRPCSVRRVARPLGGAGLFLAEGVDWRRQRRLLAPTFTPASISLLLPHFQEAGLHLLRSIENTAQVNLSKAFQETALEAVFRALFSLPENTARDKLSHFVRDYVEGPGRPSLFDAFAKREDAFAFTNGKRERFQGAWFAAIEAIIAERKAQPKRADHRDLLDQLLSLKDADTGETLSNTEIRDQCATMFFAGSETTARLLFWASYLLTQDIDEQANLRAEIVAFPPEHVRNLRDIQNWPRLQNVLMETLRLYPPLPHIVRDAIDTDVVGGEKIVAKTQVWVSAWVMHRHRRFWDQPTAFIPERFAGKAAPWTQMPAFIPFGAGPRTCIGLSFALSEVQIVLATLLGRYRISLPDAKPVLPIGRTTIEPSYELKFRLEAV